MNIQLQLQPYTEQTALWPQTGRHILAHFDDETIVVYQAYNAEIANFAAENQRFGGAFSYSRMSWIKPNFLWMMYRSSWATSPNQERILAITLRREDFDTLLAQAVESSFQPAVHASRETWQKEIASSQVRLQWDPDHDPHGRPVERRAVQLGLRDEALKKFGEVWPQRIEDITEFVHAQHVHVRAGRLDLLNMPRERVYPLKDPETRARIQLDDFLFFIKGDRTMPC